MEDKKNGIPDPLNDDGTPFNAYADICREYHDDIFGNDKLKPLDWLKDDKLDKDKKYSFDNYNPP